MLSKGKRAARKLKRAQILLAGDAGSSDEEAAQVEEEVADDRRKARGEVRQRGRDLGPTVARFDRFPHLQQELFLVVIPLPALGMIKLDVIDVNRPSMLRCGNFGM